MFKEQTKKNQQEICTLEEQMEKIQKESLSTFDEQLERVYSIAGVTTQEELAKILGIRQSFISDAKRRKQVPSGWLITLLHTQNVNPEWILTGSGPQFISTPTTRKYR